MLHDRDARTLVRLGAAQRPMLVAGTALLVLGALYMLWAVNRLHSTPAAAEPGAFDRPIAGLARLVAGVQERLDHTQPATPLERSLVEELRERTDLTGRLLLLVMRLLIGSMLATAGLGLLATAFAQRPLLDIVRRLGR